jgi:pectin methylesterase-like acyl-CoA thioesterase
LHRKERPLRGFQNAPKPNVAVAKDGSGQFTIDDALNAMPRMYAGRYVLYVKESVYEEYVTVAKEMVNVTMYSDGAQKTVITRSSNFADGFTTFKTSTISKTKNFKSLMSLCTCCFSPTTN